MIGKSKYFIKIGKSEYWSDNKKTLIDLRKKLKKEVKKL